MVIITEIDPQIASAAQTNPIVRKRLQEFLDCDSSWDEAVGRMIVELAAANDALLRQVESRSQQCDAGSPPNPR